MASSENYTRGLWVTQYTEFDKLTIEDIARPPLEPKQIRLRVRAAGVSFSVNLVVAGLAGTVIPVALERLRIDPALASGAFVTTVTDVVGFFAFLGLAVVMLL